MSKKGKARYFAKKRAMEKRDTPAEHEGTTSPDWSGECSTCGQSPIIPESGMCGPCTTGEAETAGGNW